MCTCQLWFLVLKILFFFLKCTVYFSSTTVALTPQERMCVFTGFNSAQPARLWRPSQFPNYHFLLAISFDFLLDFLSKF